MNSLFKSEFKRQLTNNPLFWTCAAIGICIALLAAWIEIQLELDILEVTYQQGNHLSYNTLLSRFCLYRLDPNTNRGILQRTVLSLMAAFSNHPNRLDFKQRFKRRSAGTAMS